MIVSQMGLIIETAKARKLATMVAEPGLVSEGALIGYGVNFYDIGKLSAKYVQRVLARASPETLPVESFSRIGLGVNLATARELGIAIPQTIYLQADKVVE